MVAALGYFLFMPASQLSEKTKLPKSKKTPKAEGKTKAKAKGKKWNDSFAFYYYIIMGNAEAKRKKKEEEELKKMEEKEKLISIAAIFLEGKNIEKVSDVQKKIFLRKKGLNDEMIE